MSKENIKKLRAHVKAKIISLSKLENRDKQQETKLAKYCAMLLLAYTGCRPTEASYVICEDSYEENLVPVPHMECKWQVKAPARITKTKRDYAWQLPEKLDFMREVVKKLDRNKIPEW